MYTINYYSYTSETFIGTDIYFRVDNGGSRLAR